MTSACNLSTVTFCGFALGLGLGAAVLIGLGGGTGGGVAPSGAMAVAPVFPAGAGREGGDDLVPAAPEADLPVPVSAPGPVRLPPLR